MKFRTQEWRERMQNTSRASLEWLATLAGVGIGLLAWKLSDLGIGWFASDTLAPILRAVSFPALIILAVSAQKAILEYWQPDEPVEAVSEVQQ